MSISLMRVEQGPEMLDFTKLRSVEESEFSAINNAIDYCRKYGNRHTVRLVRAEKIRFDGTRSNLADCPDALLPVAIGEAQVSFVSFLLMWRMFLDHARHDLSERFGGKSSTEYVAFEVATHSLFDHHPGYRLIDGLRNYVQHVGMPELDYKVSRREGGPGEAPLVAEVSVVLRRDGLLHLLRSRGGHRKLREDLSSSPATLPIVDLVQDGMVAFEVLVEHLASVDSPELKMHVERLRDILAETHPGIPMIGDLSDVNPAEGGSMKLTRFDDLFQFILNYDLR
jgi:hypothetical protein